MIDTAVKTTPQGNESTLAGAQSRVPHLLAVTLLCATWLLICVGGLVTTQGAGMAFEDWPTSDGKNMFLYPWFRAAHDKFIEHGHRLSGVLVGVISIALCGALWLKEQRRWLAWLGVFALAFVIFQGVLGGLRVRTSDVQFAKIHGCVAPLFFSVVVAIVVFTSPWWRERKLVCCTASGRLRRLAIFTTVLAYLQLVLGAQLRHVTPGSNGEIFRLAVVFHLAVAAVLLLDVILLFLFAKRSLPGHKALIRPTQWLLVLVLFQLLLGMGTWVLKYSWPAGLFADSRLVAGWTNTAGGVVEAIVVTGHVAVGSLILGTALLATLRFMHGLRKAPAAAMEPVSLMGVTL